MAQTDLVDPASIHALEDMGSHLAALESFSVTAKSQMEIVLDTDQKLLIGGTTDYSVRRPDHLMVDLTTDVVHRVLYYDGASAQFVAPEEEYYAEVEDVPGTISELLQQMAARYSVTFPAADLFAWGTPDAPVDLVQEGFYVGPATVDGVAAEHWAYRTADQDWEVWLQAEGDPLPLQISLVDKEDLARPRFSMQLSWNTGASFADDAFEFTPSDGMSQITFIEQGAAQAEDGQ